MIEDTFCRFTRKHDWDYAKGGWRVCVVCGCAGRWVAENHRWEQVEVLGPIEQPKLCNCSGPPKHYHYLRAAEEARQLEKMERTFERLRVTLSQGILTDGRLRSE
jgi:hypothetical protein